MDLVTSAQAIKEIDKFLLDYTGHSSNNYTSVEVVYGNDIDESLIEPYNYEIIDRFPVFIFINGDDQVNIEMCMIPRENIFKIESQIAYLMVCMAYNMFLDIDGITLSNEEDTSFIDFESLYSFLEELYNSGFIELIQ